MDFNGSVNFNGGVQNFGGTNDVTQNNYCFDAALRGELETRIAALRAVHPDPSTAEREIPVLEEAVRRPSLENRGRVDTALERLATNAGNTRTALEAVAAIGALVAAHWPA